VRVSLFVTCLVDQLWPTVGSATVEVLRRAGCDVVFDERQTCCGQPAFNSGYRKDAAAVARQFLELYRDVDAVVLPSGSCTAMTKHMAELFPEGDEMHAVAKDVGSKAFELSAFLVHELGIDDVGARFDGRVTWHDACHGLRDLGLRDEPRRLLSKVAGLELVEAERADACCGFGGTFSVKYPEISVAIADHKLEELRRLDIDAVVSGDASCLMQLGGRLQRTADERGVERGGGRTIETLHLAEVLARR
jgi:L-lactate dehydrogenase complex protein LldE